jgi:acyl-coenzyme A thioesterase PaaI-like protein
MDGGGYRELFGVAGASLTESQWVDRANRHLTPNLAALDARFLDGSREERWLRVAYEPGPHAINFVQFGGGSIAEMLDQAATYCGTLVTGLPCSTLRMTVSVLRPATTKSFVATGRVLGLTQAMATLGADLADETGRRVATITVVSQLIADLGRLQ